jgi:hypothetical protein
MTNSFLLQKVKLPGRILFSWGLPHVEEVEGMRNEGQTKDVYLFKVILRQSRTASFEGSLNWVVNQSIREEDRDEDGVVSNNYF